MFYDFERNASPRLIDLRSHGLYQKVYFPTPFSPTSATWRNFRKYRNSSKTWCMRPTVDDVGSCWRSLYLTRLGWPVYLLHVGYPWLPNMSAFSIFYFLATVFSCISYTCGSISHATSPTTMYSVSHSLHSCSGLRASTRTWCLDAGCMMLMIETFSDRLNGGYVSESTWKQMALS